MALHTPRAQQRTTVRPSASATNSPQYGPKQAKLDYVRLSMSSCSSIVAFGAAPKPRCSPLIIRFEHQNMPISDEDRYSRQVLFAPIGPEGQQRLRQSRAVVVG